MRQISTLYLGLVKYLSCYSPGYSRGTLLPISSQEGSQRPVLSSRSPAVSMLLDVNFIYRAGDLMQDLKTGHLIHASPRAQFFGQLIGSSVSIVVTSTAYSLYQRAYTIPGPSFPAPTAYVWLSLARLLRTYSPHFVSP